MKNSKFKKITKCSAILALGVVAIGTGTTVLASTWTANSPESIKIVEGQNSYTMVEGDTLWAIGMKINVNIKTLAVVNNINLSNGEEYHLKIGTVIRWDKGGNLTAETSEGKQINGGVELKDSNKIISSKPLGTDVTSDVQSKGISDEQILGDEDVTVNPVKPETPTPVEPEVPVKPETPTPVEPEVPAKPETPTPVEPEVPVEPETPTPVEPEVPTKPEIPVPVEPEVPAKPKDPTEPNEVKQRYTVWYEGRDTNEFDIVIGTKIFDTKAEAYQFIDNYADDFLIEGYASNSYGVSIWSE